MPWLDSIAVFCGARHGSVSSHAEAIVALGTLIGRQRRRLIYGGGRVGLMGRVADAALAAGGEVIGVIPQSLFDRELGHTGLTALHVVDGMHERKALMAELAGGFIAAPGGYGTLDETFEALTWTQLGLQAKPVGLLNVAGFYRPLLDFLDALPRAGFVDPRHTAMLVHAEQPQALLDALDAWTWPGARAEVQGPVRGGQPVALR